MKIEIKGCNIEDLLKAIENSQIEERNSSEKEENELFDKLDNFYESQPILTGKTKEKK